MSIAKSLIAVAAAVLVSVPLCSGAPGSVSLMTSAHDESDRLFEYPVPPAGSQTQLARARWQMKHFWDPMNFDVESVNQSALNDAFRAYTENFRLASDADILSSVDALVKRIRKNPALTLQFAEAAEASLYGPKADIWCDAAYIPFLKAAVRQKKLPASRRKRYDQQLRTMSKSVIGSIAPSFEYKNPLDEKQRYRPGKSWTLIEFGDPANELSALSRQLLDADPKFSGYLDSGRIEAFFIIPNPDEYWELTFDSAPTKWNYGAAEGIDDIFDIRAMPSFYLIGPDKRIYLKHVPAADALSFFTELFDKEDQLKEMRKKHFQFD